MLCAASGHVLAGALGACAGLRPHRRQEGARFGTPEINVGVFPFMITALIGRNVGRKKTNELLLLGQRIDADEALRIGIVNRVVAAGRVRRGGRRLGVRLAAKSPLLMRLGKDAMFRQQDLPFVEALDYGRSPASRLRLTEDAHEGIKAFLEKRERSGKAVTFCAAVPHVRPHRRRAAWSRGAG